MTSSKLFSFEPTFTQGFIIGQFSIVIILILVLRHLFFDSRVGRRLETPTYHPHLSEEKPPNHTSYAERCGAYADGGESAVWFNVILRNVLEAYRSKLRNDMNGPTGDEVVRKRVEELANRMRPANVLDPIKIHSIDLGTSFPSLSNAHCVRSDEQVVEMDMHYTDTVSVSLSTGVLVNFPKPAFARLPISLTISLSLFQSKLLITPPEAGSHAPSLTLTIPPTFTLELKTTSLMGSRAKLADVPKLHELIQNQLRRVLVSRGTFKVVLPGLASVAEVKEEIRKEQSQI